MKLNKILALLLCFALITASLPAFAEAAEIKWICKKSTATGSAGELRYPEIPEGYGNYFTDWGGISVDAADWWGHALHIGNTDGWLSYSVPVETAGVYELFVTAGTYENFPATLTIEVNGEEVTSALVDTCYWEPHAKVSLGYLPLNEGENDIKVIINQKGGGALALQYFSLQMLDAPVLSGFKANGESFCDGDTLKRGTDNISIECTNTFNEKSTVDAQITLADENSDTIPVIARENDGALVLSILKTLDYSKNYILTVSGLKDAYGYVLEDFSVSFKSSGEDGDIATATAVITEAPDLQNTTLITAKGIIKNSNGDGIEGRKAILEIKAPDKSVLATLDAVSKEGGTVEFSYQLPENADAGLYSLSLDCEYAQESATDTVRYISESLKIQILGEIEKAASWSSVESIFTSYSQELGISLSELDEKRDEESGAVIRYGLTDKNLFYARFVNQRFEKIEDFADTYKLNLAIERFLQNCADKDRKAILSDSENIAVLGFDEGLLDSLTEENNEKFWKDTALITREAASTKADIIKELEKIANKYFLLQLGKENMTLFVDSATVYTGQQAVFNLKCAETEDLYSYEMTLTSDTDISGKIGFETVSSGEKVVITESEGSVKVAVTDLKKPTFVSLGKLTFETERAATAEFNLTGRIAYKSADFPYIMYADIEPCKFTLTVKENTGSAGPSYSQGSFGGGAPSKKEEKPQEAVKPEAEEYEFTDLQDSSWAEDSIYALLNKGVISKSDDNKFRPGDNVTRAEFVKMLVMTLGIYDESAKESFSDVSESSWYAKYVASAEKNGMILGSGDNLFNPDGAITRQDICVILSRVMDKMGYKEESYEAVFKDDYDIADYAKNAVYRLYDFKIINGMGDGIFAPQSPATRAMTAKMLVEFLKGVEA